MKRSTNTARVAAHQTVGVPMDEIALKQVSTTQPCSPFFGPS